MTDLDALAALERLADQSDRWVTFDRATALDLVALARKAEGLERALWDARAALVAEHGHDGDAYAPWPSCLPVHIALNRAKEALAATTHPDV
jgi:hypothetical protein